MENIEQLTDIKYQIDKIGNNDLLLINENANKDTRTFSGKRDLIAGQVSKAVGLSMLNPRVAEAHTKGDIHYHDLDYSPYTEYTNCCLIDIEYMQEHGFKMGNAEIESPKSIQTAVAQIAQIIANVASSQYGGTSVDKIDIILAKYAKMNWDKHYADAADWEIPDVLGYTEEKTKKDIYDSIQSLEWK